MATSYKALAASDRVTTRTLLHENIPITGTIVSGTYKGPQTGGPEGRELNIKTFSHGMYQSVYDYPYVSSSANHIFDIAVGFSTHGLSGSAASVAGSQVAKKVNMYNRIAQTLAGYDSDGNIRRFDVDGSLGGANDHKHDNAFFLSFSRLLVKDEIKKGTFSLTLGTNAAYATPFDGGQEITISDSAATGSYLINSPAGEYGLLFTGTVFDTTEATPVGLLYYQAGIAVLTSSVFGPSTIMALEEDGGGSGYNVENLLTGSSIDAFADAVRHRVKNIQFNNTTELNSTVYFCRAHHNEFNYSSNTTYLTGSRVRTMEPILGGLPSSYVTTVGLYSADNELLAVAKLSEPLKKQPTNELTLRVRLDY